LLSLLLGVAAYLSRAHRWYMQIRPTGHAPSYKNTYNAMMVGYLANHVLPRMGEVMRCSMLRRSDGIPVNTAFGTVIAERIIDMVMLLLFLGLTFLLEVGRLRDFLFSLFSDKYTSLEESFGSLYLVVIVVMVLGALFLALGLLYLNRLRQN